MAVVDSPVVVVVDVDVVVGLDSGERCRGASAGGGLTKPSREGKRKQLHTSIYVYITSEQRGA